MSGVTLEFDVAPIIRELVKNRPQVEQDMILTGMFDADDELTITMSDVQTIASLIAQECARMCESTGGMAGEYWTDKCAIAIRERFGLPRADR